MKTLMIFALIFMCLPIIQELFKIIFNLIFTIPYAILVYACNTIEKWMDECEN